MKEGSTNEKKIAIIFCSVLVLVLVVEFFVGVRQSRCLRKQLDDARYELSCERDTNRRLNEAIGECREVTTRIGEIEIEDRATVRECIQIVREIRKQVEVLAEVCSRFDGGGDTLYNNNGGSN